jgi:hypothetical protein
MKEDLLLLDGYRGRSDKEFIEVRMGFISSTACMCKILIRAL